MKIPKLPQTPDDIVIQIDQIDRRIKTLAVEESRLRKSRSQLSKTRSDEYARYVETKSPQAFIKLDKCEASELATKERLELVCGEIQTLNLRRRYLERLAHKNSAVLRPTRKQSEKSEPNGGSFGA